MYYLDDQLQLSKIRGEVRTIAFFSESEIHRFHIAHNTPCLPYCPSPLPPKKQQQKLHKHYFHLSLRRL